MTRTRDGRTLLAMHLDEPSTSDVAIVRRTVRAAAVAGGARIRLDDLELIVSELAANAVLHAEGPFDVTLTEQDSGVLVEVVDTRPGRVPPPVERAALEETGRGLMVVAALAPDWGWDADPVARTKRVWARLPFVDDPSTP